MRQKPNNRLTQAVKETREHLQLNGDGDADDEDATDLLLDECGKTIGGYCLMAGSEYCEFECPFR